MPLPRPAPPTGAAQHGQEHQRHGQGSNQTDNHRQRQELHELPDNAGPEQQRHKHRQRGCGRRNNGPGHATGRLGPGVLYRLPLRQVPVRQLRHNNGAIHQHAGHQDQTEQHHDVEREPHAPDHQDAGEEGTRNRQPHHNRRTRPHGGNHHNQNQHDGGEHVIQQVTENIPDFLGLVHDVADFQRVRQLRSGLINQLTNLGNGLDNVGTRALGDFQHQRRLPIDTSETGGVLEGTLEHGHIAEGDHCVTVHLDRHGHHILDGFDHPGHFQGHAAIAGIQRAGRHQLIVAGYQRSQLIKINAIALQHLGIDHDFQQILPIATNLHFQNFRDRLDGILEPPGDGYQLPLRQGARQTHGQHREQGHVDLVYPGFIRFLGQLGTCCIHFLPHVLKRLVRIKPGIELQHHRGMTFRGGTTHFLDAFKRTQLLLHGPHQQTLGVLRADAIQGHGDIDHGDGDVGVGFLRDGLKRGNTPEQEEQKRQQGGPAAINGCEDQCAHAV